MLVNQHASVLTWKLKIFNCFGASGAGRVNSQHLYTLMKALGVFYQKTDCLNFLLPSIYQTGIVRTTFGLNQHTSTLAECTRLLAYKHRVYGI